MKEYAPFLLPLLFPLFFITIVRLLAWMGGWSQLAHRFADPIEPRSTQLYSSGPTSARMGWVNYNSALWYQLYPDALRLGVFVLLRIGHPTLLIPRDQISDVQVKAHWFGFSYVILKLDGLTLKILTRDPSKIENWYRQS